MPVLPANPHESTPDATAADVMLAASGDTRAFERLYDDHGARVHSLARRMLGAEHADEATQEVFVRAWRKLATFRGESAFGTWLHRVALHVLLARRRALAEETRRFVEDADRIGSVPARHATPDLAIDLDTAIAELPAGAREVFVLHDLEGYKHQEIAGMLGVSVGTSKSQLHRARMLLREFFTR